MPAPWKNSYDKPRQFIKKQRYHFDDNGLYSQCHGFSSSHVWMWDLDHKMAEHQIIDVSKLWCLRRLLKLPWAARTSSQSILNEMNSEYSLEVWIFIRGFYSPDLNSQLIGKGPDVGKIVGKRRRGWQKIRWLGGITDSMDMSLSKLREIMKDRETWGAVSKGSQRVGHKLASEQQKQH